MFCLMIRKLVDEHAVTRHWQSTGEKLVGFGVICCTSKLVADGVFVRVIVHFV
jgi:hypothetical protein